MLVIISDLHLTDGTSGETIEAGAFRVFRQRLRDLAYDASHRRDGRYAPIKELHILLLGDILDVIRSTKWLDDKVRPWDPQLSDAAIMHGALANKVSDITDAILTANSASLDVLRGLSCGKKKDRVTLPPATAEGKVDGTVGWNADAKGRGEVNVKIHYLVGNHDWFYHVRGSKYDSIREKVVTDMGLSNAPNVPFPHDPVQAAEIMDVMDQHRVFARHGDIYDSFNYMEDEGRAASSLGDAIVIELLGKFSQEIAKEKAIPQDVKDGMRELDNVRPVMLLPLWISGLLRRCSADSEHKKLVKTIWNRLADKFLDLDFVKQQDTWNPVDDVDKLQAALKFSKRLSLSGATRILRWLHDTFGGSSGDTYHKHALEEPGVRSQQARYVVYGHTHHQDVVALDVAQPRNKLEVKQVYINTGTWRRVHELAQRDARDEEFIEWNVMTYAAFFTGDERRGREFESWTGSLGVDPGEET